MIKPGMRSAGSTQRIEGCRCVDDVQALTDKVDLLVLAISASQIPGVLAEVIENRKAEAVVVIPGGLEEKEGTEALVARMQTSLATARASDWRGPVINGGNCLGIRSVPGRYDTFFIPENKLPAPRGPPSPVARDLAERSVRHLPDLRPHRGQPQVCHLRGKPDGPHGGRLSRLPQGQSRHRRLCRLSRGLQAGGWSPVSRRRSRDHRRREDRPSLPRRPDPGRRSGFLEPHRLHRRGLCRHPAALPKRRRRSRGLPR